MSLFEQGYLIVQKGLAYEEATVSITAVGLPSIPTKQVRRVLIQVQGAPVRYIPVAGQTPTGSYGLELNDGDYFVYDGDVEDIEFIRDDSAAQDATLRICYFGA